MRDKGIVLVGALTKFLLKPMMVALEFFTIDDFKSFLI
jgi:hypothetical protein